MSHPTNLENLHQSVLVIDAMVVVQKQVVNKTDIKNCKDLGRYFVNSINGIGKGYKTSYVIFDDYSVETSLKDATRQLRNGGKASYKRYKVEDDTKIHDFTSFLSSTTTKDNLASYLANLVKILASIPVVVMTRSAVLTNQLHDDIISDNSSHEEADTKMMFVASLIARSGLNVHIYSPDTDVFVLTLSMLHILGPETIIIVGSGETKRNIKLHDIYDVLGRNRAEALPAMHALSGCDTTGHLQKRVKFSGLLFIKMLQMMLLLH